MPVPMPDNWTDRCHCLRNMEGSDHCPFCGCEEYERYCNAHYPSGKHPTRTWMPGDPAGTWPGRYVTS